MAESAVARSQYAVYQSFSSSASIITSDDSMLPCQAKACNFRVVDTHELAGARAFVGRGRGCTIRFAQGPIGGVGRCSIS